MPAATQAAQPSINVAALADAHANSKNSAQSPAHVGDVWHRVEGSHIGEERYEGMELAWTSWSCIKTTKRGAWFKCVELSFKGPRFALTSGSRFIVRTKHEALERLIARKERHLRLLASEAVAAQDTLDIAREALAQCKADAKVTTSSCHPAG